jgi:glyoxylase-like metal-dependent hydrolase (beta-lactamase superfamily II)
VQRFAAVLLALLTGCTLHLDRLRPEAEPIPTSWPWLSTAYAARTDGGVVLFDLGWYGVEGALERGLARIGARPDEVTDVFLTHSHRDHIAGWNAVRQARFHLHRDELPLFLAEIRHADLPSRAASAVLASPAPWPEEIAVRPFSDDTVWAFGADTLRAFVVPGHTAGSTAYLFRGILFAGDAIHRSPVSGFGPAPPLVTDDVRTGHASVERLFERALPHGVRWVCTAHGKCAPPGPRFVRKVLR